MSNLFNDGDSEEITDVIRQLIVNLFLSFSSIYFAWSHPLSLFPSQAFYAMYYSLLPPKKLNVLFADLNFYSVHFEFVFYVYCGLLCLFLVQGIGTFARNSAQTSKNQNEMILLLLHALCVYHVKNNRSSRLHLDTISPHHQCVLDIKSFI